MALAIGALLLGASHRLSAQEEPVRSVPLTASALDFIPLATGETTGEVSFLVDETDVISVEVRASVNGLAASIEAPGGEVLEASTISSFGGEIAIFEVPFDAQGFTLPNTQPGFHHRFDFPSLGSGSYTVRVQASAPLVESGAALVQVQTNSPVVAGLLITTPEESWAIRPSSSPPCSKTTPRSLERASLRTWS